MKQVCTSDGPGAVLPDGDQVLHGPQAPPLLHHPPLHSAGRKFLFLMFSLLCLIFLPLTGSQGIKRRISQISILVSPPEHSQGASQARRGLLHPAQASAELCLQQQHQPAQRRGAAQQRDRLAEEDKGTASQNRTRGCP